jgi:cobalamin biosynthesis protein CbiD
VTLSSTTGLCAAATASVAKAGSLSKQDQAHDVHELEKISRRR